jgi:hypothetical protein
MEMDASTSNKTFDVDRIIADEPMERSRSLPPRHTTELPLEGAGSQPSTDSRPALPNSRHPLVEDEVMRSRPSTPSPAASSQMDMITCDYSNLPMSKPSLDRETAGARRSSPASETASRPRSDWASSSFFGARGSALPSSPRPPPAGANMSPSGHWRDDLEMEDVTNAHGHEPSAALDRSSFHISGTEDEWYDNLSKLQFTTRPNVLLHLNTHTTRDRGCCSSSPNVQEEAELAARVVRTLRSLVRLARSFADAPSSHSSWRGNARRLQGAKTRPCGRMQRGERGRGCASAMNACRSGVSSETSAPRRHARSGSLGPLTSTVRRGLG